MRIFNVLFYSLLNKTGIKKENNPDNLHFSWYLFPFESHKNVFHSINQIYKYNNIIILINEDTVEKKV